MRNRNKRDSARRRDFMEWQHSRERDYGRDEPWREERRERYPDEPYGGERRRSEGEWPSYRYQSNTGSRQWGSGGADYRGDFGRESREDYRREQRSGRAWDKYAREGDRARGDDLDAESRWRGRSGGGFGAASDSWNSGGSFGFGPDEGVEDRGSYGYGSPYGQGDLNSDRSGRGDWRDSDWTANRPARGRGTWGGDWADTRANVGMAGFRGKGPKDYRRSDERIREEVCDVFTDDSGLDASEVSIEVESGEVTLTGNVTTRDQKRRAEDLAERITGVRDVINQLRVARGEITNAATSQGREKTARGNAATSGVAAERNDR